jgi:hypothetical protein
LCRQKIKASLCSASKAQPIHFNFVFQHVYSLKIDSLIIAVLYNHFYQMKIKGRKVIPWFQTVTVLSFLFVVLAVLIFFIISMLINKGHYQISFSETTFLIVFMALLILCFFLIKKTYFDTNRHLLFLAEFKSLPVSKQRRNKFWVLASIVLSPFIMLAILYFSNKR